MKHRSRNFASRDGDGRWVEVGFFEWVGVCFTCSLRLSLLAAHRPSTARVDDASGLSGGRRRRARSAGRGRKSACRRPCRSGRRSKTTSTRRARTPNPCGTCPARAGSGPRGSRRDRRRLSVFRRFAEGGARGRRGCQRRTGAGLRVGAASGGREPRRERVRARLGLSARGETDARGPIDAPIDRVCRAMPPGTIAGAARSCVAVWRSAPAAKPIAERAAIVRGVGAEQCGDRRVKNDSMAERRSTAGDEFDRAEAKEASRTIDLGFLLVREPPNPPNQRFHRENTEVVLRARIGHRAAERAR